MDLDADIAACATLVARGDPPRFRATMAAPVAMRRRLFPLYAFNLEVARAPWVTQEPMIALMRLQWWRDALGEIASGGVVRRHEVVTPLAASIDAQAARDLDDAVAARELDLEKDAPESLDQITTYIDRTAGTLLWTAARLAGADHEAQARQAARAQGIAAFLTAIPDLLKRGHHPLPHGDPASFAATLAQDGLTSLTAFRETTQPKTARPVFHVLTEAHSILHRIANDPESVLAKAPDQPSLRTRLALALRTSLNAP